MSAYTPGFVTPVAKGASGLTATAIVSPDSLDIYEPMLAADEIVTTQSGDLVMAKANTILFTSTVTLEDAP